MIINSITPNKFIYSKPKLKQTFGSNQQQAELFKEELWQDKSTIGGTINGKLVNLKKESKNYFIAQTHHYNGIMDNKIVDIDIAETRITGIVGAKKINLQADSYNKNFSLTGTIDDKKIEISKDTPITASQGEEDILTLVASLSGFSFEVKDNQFKSTKPSIIAQSIIDSENTEEVPEPEWLELFSYFINFKKAS